MITIEKLSYRYGDILAVDDLSLTIESGSLFGLLGPNGAGKTTTISCVAGLLAPSVGKITVDGIDVSKEPVRAKRIMGVVPQALALYPSLTVVQNLHIFGGLFGLHGRKLGDRTAWGLALAQLDNSAASRVDTLSGGMKRRLNLACALMHEPSIIICDEPTTGVDPQSRNHIFGTIRELNRSGKTVIYTTHYMEEVEALCERIAIVDKGRIVVEDSLKALLARSSVATRFDVTLEKPSTADAIRNALQKDGCRVGEVLQSGRTLEEVFLDVTGKQLRDER